MSLGYGFEKGQDDELLVQNVSRTQRLSSVASCLMIARTGVMVADSYIHTMGEDLAQLREEWGLTPDQMMSALVLNEPDLGHEW